MKHKDLFEYETGYQEQIGVLDPMGNPHNFWYKLDGDVSITEDDYLLAYIDWIDRKYEQLDDNINLFLCSGSIYKTDIDDDDAVFRVQWSALSEDSGDWITERLSLLKSL